MAVGYVRPARPDDGGEIARVQLTTWRVAYGRLLPKRVLDQLEHDALAQRWREAIEAPPSPAHRVLVAIEQAETTAPAETIGWAASTAPAATGDPAPPEPPKSYLVGFAAAGPPDEAALAPGEGPEALTARTVAVTELLVEPRWGRRGHGSRLLAACVDLWRADGFDTAVAWAFDRDPATLAFLSSAGWEPDGARRALDVDDLLLPQIRLHAALA